METKMAEVPPEGQRISRRGWAIRLQLPPLPHASFNRSSQWGPPNSSPGGKRVLAGALRLTCLAHATGAHHCDLDQAAACRPQAAIGGGYAARGGVLGDSAHVLNEAHHRFGRGFTARDGTCETERGSRCAGAGSGTGQGAPRY